MWVLGCRAQGFRCQPCFKNFQRWALWRAEADLGERRDKSCSATLLPATPRQVQRKGGPQGLQGWDRKGKQPGVTSWGWAFACGVDNWPEQTSFLVFDVPDCELLAGGHLRSFTESRADPHRDNSSKLLFAFKIELNHSGPALQL